jgi:membrane fusion protein
VTGGSSLFRQEVLGGRADRLHGAILLSQSISSRVITAALVIIIAAIGAWLALGSYARIETARGILVPSGGATKVFALRAGIVTELRAEEGKIVAAGQKLAVIKSDQPSGEGQNYTEEGVLSLAAQEDLASARIGLAGERSVGESGRVAVTVDGLIKQRTNLENQLRLQRQAVTSTGTTFEQMQTLVVKGFVSKVEIERRRQAWISAQQQEGQIVQQLGQIETDLRRSHSDLARSAVEQKTSVADARSSLQTLRQQKSRLKSEGAYSIEAPSAGRVTALQTGLGRTVGGQVPLMTIIPDGGTLRADIYAPSRAIGFVHQGQEVKLLYDAFPYQRFGSFTGHIAAISRVVLSPAELDAPLKIEEPVYRVTVDLDKQAIQAFGENISLQPGMTLSANIVLNRQSFWDWLMNPLRAVRNRT